MIPSTPSDRDRARVASPGRARRQLEDPITALDLIALAAFDAPTLEDFGGPGGPGGPMAGLVLGGLVSLLLPLAAVVLAIVITVSVVRTRRATERIEKRLEALERASREASTAGREGTGARPDATPR
jgi:membrane protein implicated in regulation of membrane protease activity